MVATAVSTLYPALNDLLNDAGAGIATALLKIKPNQVADLLVEEKFAVAASVFKALGGSVERLEKA